jgi:hypothetical protein
VRRPVLVGSVIAVAVLALVVAGVIIIWQVSDPGPASVGEAVDRFQQDGAVDDGGGAGEPARPPEGVYEYAGEGSERISFPPVSQQDGAVIPGTVSHQAGGCWVFRLDYNAAHWQDWRYCPADGRIADTGGRTHQAWDFGVTEVESLSVFECDPPGPLFPPDEPGWTVEHRCTGTSDQVAGTATSAGTWRYVGPDTVTVAGDRVDVWHFRQQRTISGAQDGSQTADFWFREDGLLLRAEREVEVRSPSPIGDVTYTESGRVALTGLEPRR